MSYLDKLKQLDGGEIFHHAPKPEPTKPTKGGFFCFVGSTPGENEKIRSDNYADALVRADDQIFQKVARPLPTKPSKGTEDGAAHWHWIIQLPERVIEVYCHPAYTRAEVLRRHPDALDLEPMPEASSTATPEQSAELAALVRAVGREYGFDAAELTEALEAAGRDPAGAWLSYRAMAHELGIELAP
jgi:hypothetical protein